MAVETSYITHSRWTGLSATELTYPDGRQVSSGYDPLYRRNSIKETSGGASIASWQFFGQRTATTSLGNGITTSYMNDAQNRSAIQYGQTTPGWGSITTDQLGYDGAGRLIGKRHFNGSDVTVGFTSAYDKSSNKLFERPLHAESRASLYDSYDSMNRLLDYQRGVLASGGGSITTPISLPYANQEQAYNLDGLGNWTSTTITPEGGSPAVQSRIHNKLNEVTKYGATSVFYDHGNNTAPHGRRGNGNIADDGIRTYAYDAFNRLTTISRKSDGATIGQYTYDALGRRIQKITSNGGVSLAWSTLGIAQWSQLGVQDWANLPLDPSILNATYRYVCDGQQIVEELDGSDSTTRQFIWGQYIDELIQMKTYVDTGSQPLAAGTYYLLSDLLYRSTALTDSSGDIQEAYDCDAYGNTLIFSGPGTDDTWFTDDDVTSLQPACETIFTGRQYDPESQIYFYRARYYHPQLGRFVSRDPIEYQDGMNLYEYVSANPSIAMDPSGLAKPLVPDDLWDLISHINIHGPPRCEDDDCCPVLKAKLATWYSVLFVRTVKNLFYESIGLIGPHGTADTDADGAIRNCWKLIPIKCKDDMPKPLSLTSPAPTRGGSGAPAQTQPKAKQSTLTSVFKIQNALVRAAGIVGRNECCAVGARLKNGADQTYDDVNHWLRTVWRHIDDLVPLPQVPGIPVKQHG